MDCYTNVDLNFANFLEIQLFNHININEKEVFLLSPNILIAINNVYINTLQKNILTREDIFSQIIEERNGYSISMHELQCIDKEYDLFSLNDQGKFLHYINNMFESKLDEKVFNNYSLSSYISRDGINQERFKHTHLGKKSYNLSLFGMFAYLSFQHLPWRFLKYYKYHNDGFFKKQNINIIAYTNEIIAKRDSLKSNTIQDTYYKFNFKYDLKLNSSKRMEESDQTLDKIMISYMKNIHHQNGFNASIFSSKFANTRELHLLNTLSAEISTYIKHIETESSQKSLNDESLDKIDSIIKKIDNRQTGLDYEESALKNNNAIEVQTKYYENINRQITSDIQAIEQHGDYDKNFDPEIFNFDRLCQMII